MPCVGGFDQYVACAEVNACPLAVILGISHLSVIEVMDAGCEIVVLAKVVSVHHAAEMVRAVVGVAELQYVVRHASEQCGVSECRAEFAIANGDVLATQCVLS